MSVSFHDAVPVARKWHAERKARLARINARAYVPPSPRMPEPEPEVVLEPTPAKIGRDWLLIHSEGEPLTVKQIIESVSFRHQISIGEMLGPRRHKAVKEARWEAINLVRQHKPHLSLPQIGRIFNRDHTTILNALNALKRKKR